MEVMDSTPVLGVLFLGTAWDVYITGMISYVPKLPITLKEVICLNLSLFHLIQFPKL